MREFAQMFFRKLIKRYPEQSKSYLLGLAGSDDPLLRRFVGETLRPVQENRWFYRDPEYPLSILKRMFREAAPYPRTSVGNNLSDLARRLPELVYEQAGKLAGNGDRNSFWIACRACRNLVKKEPLRVMDLLGLDEYRYKKRIYRRHDCQRDCSKIRLEKT
jgi:3-methyladenine DNA glycosylase AlkC